MNNFVRIYLLIAAGVGSFYFIFWYKHLKPDVVHYTTKINALFIYLAVFIGSGLLAPLTIYVLLK